MRIGQSPAWARATPTNSSMAGEKAEPGSVAMPYSKKRCGERGITRTSPVNPSAMPPMHSVQPTPAPTMRNAVYVSSVAKRTLGSTLFSRKIFSS